MIILFFILALFVTFVVTRTFAHKFHDMKNYGTKKERSNTITGILREKTNYDWHHFHLGIIILLIVIPIILLKGLGNIGAIFLAIGISLFIDQLVPIIYRKINYFHKKSLVISFLFHLIILLLAVIFYYFIN